MGFTSRGLPNGGHTQHYAISYDEALSRADGLDRTIDLQAACEQDLALIRRWFTGIEFIFAWPIPVQIRNDSSGGVWHDPPDVVPDTMDWSPTVGIGPGSGTPPSMLRYLLVMEMTEMFMASQDAGWFDGRTFYRDEGSKGEGLSRYLAAQFLIVNNITDLSANKQTATPPPAYTVAMCWLNGDGSQSHGYRKNYVDHNPDDYHPDAITGCTTLFLYYLTSQLGYSIEAIIANPASNLSGVHKKLTGNPDGWTPFVTLVNAYYPPGYNYNPVGDNIFPVSNLASFASPNSIVCGYGDATQITIDSPAMAEVNITLTCDDPALVSVPALVTVPVGGTSVSVPISTTAIAGPFDPKFIAVHATYGGRTLTMTVELVPPHVASVTLSPGAVVCGDPSTGTVTLNRPSLNGDVLVDLVCSSPGFASVQAQVPVPQGMQSANFPVTTPNIQIPFPTAHATIQASYAGSAAWAQLTVTSRIKMGILQSLTIAPTTVTQGGIVRATVTLIEGVSTPTTVSLAAVEGGGPIPRPSNNPPIASVPPPLTIPPWQLSESFTITTRRELLPHTTREVTIYAGAVVTKTAILTVTS
jgi:hypothetical protein